VAFLASKESDPDAKPDSTLAGPEGLMPYPKTVHFTNFYHPRSGGISAFYATLFRHASEYGRQIRLVVPGEEIRSEQVGTCARLYYFKAPRSPAPNGGVAAPNSW
jgi:hypothetical protein